MADDGVLFVGGGGVGAGVEAVVLSLAAGGCGVMKTAMMVVAAKAVVRM